MGVGRTARVDQSTGPLVDRAGGTEVGKLGACWGVLIFPTGHLLRPPTRSDGVRCGTGLMIGLCQPIVNRT